MGETTFARLRGLYWAAKLAVVEYEPEAAALTRFLRPGDVCIDVGANFGQYAVRLARTVGAAGHVHCFEPHPYNRRVLRSVLGWRGIRNVTVYPLAAGERQQELCLATLDDNTAETHIAPEGLRATGVALDDWAEQVGLERLDFLKIDAEGYEAHVLAGAQRLLARFRPAILCEVNADAERRYGTHPAVVFELLVGAGYSAHQWRERRLQPVSTASPGCNNYFFIPQAAARAAAR
jgi:FkbM family methyltransferase